MEFLAITRRRVEHFSEAEIAELLPGEAVAARALYANGTFRALHSRGDVAGAIITVEARDADHASEILATLPLAKAGMMEVQVIPVLPYRGFVNS